MSSGLDKAVKDIIQTFREAGKNKPAPFDTQAEVVRVDGDTAWVHVPGGVDETPVKLTINAKVGDKIQIHVGGGRAWITGNATAPPTDDQTAIYARTIAKEARTTATQAQETADGAQTVAEDAQDKASEAITKANGSVASDTLHYLATDKSSGVTISTAGWTTSIQTITAAKPYLWIYHTYTKANGSVTHTQPVIIGTFGKDGTSVTILGSYDTLAQLKAAHPTGSLGDSYMVAGDLYVWNGSDWENVGQIQGPKGDKGDKGETGSKGDTGAQGAKGDNGVSVTGVYPQYYLSTSATELRDGGDWTETLNYRAGRYIWTRERITYSNGGTSYSSAIYNSALTTAWINANSARQIAEDTNQHFWMTETGTDTGAHITEKTQEEFLDDPANGGGNLLARSNGIAVRDGLDELAVFSANGAQIGLDTGAHTIIDEDGMQIFAEEVSGGSVVELANIGYGEGNTASGTGYAPYYSLGTRRRTSNVYDNTATYKVGDLVLYGDPQKTYVCVTDIATPEAWTQSHWKLAIGNYSLAEGFNTTASGQHSHAEGSATVATGALSHAEGLGSIASGGGSHAGGFGSVASGQYSFAQGHKAKAIGQYSIALGVGAEATGVGSIALSGTLIFNGSPLADFVTEQGTNNGWNYKKWYSGKYEAWRNYQATSLVITTASAGTYYGGEKNIPFPSFHQSLEASIFSNTLTQSSGVYIFSTVANGSNLKIYYRAHASINNASCGGFFYIRGTY